MQQRRSTYRPEGIDEAEGRTGTLDYSSAEPSTFQEPGQFSVLQRRRVVVVLHGDLAKPAQTVRSGVPKYVSLRTLTVYLTQIDGCVVTEREDARPELLTGRLKKPVCRQTAAGDGSILRKQKNHGQLGPVVGDLGGPPTR